MFCRLESYERNDNFANDPVILPPSVMPDWPDGGFRQLQQAHHHLMPAILEGHVVGYFHYRVACDQQLNSDIQAVTKGKALVVAKHVQTCSWLTDGTSVYFTGIVRAMMKRKVKIKRTISASQLCLIKTDSTKLIIQPMRLCCSNICGSLFA